MTKAKLGLSVADALELTLEDDGPAPPSGAPARVREMLGEACAARDGYSVRIEPSSGVRICVSIPRD